MGASYDRSYDQGGPAVSYKWTGWIWEKKNRMKFKTAGKLHIIVEEFME